MGTLEERMQDVKTRMPKYANRDDFPQLIAAAYEIEKQIQNEVSFSLNDINDDLKNISNEELLNLNI